ncbi:MAG: YceI family protein [Verrucomicrobiota bacterium]
MKFAHLLPVLALTLSGLFLAGCAEDPSGNVPSAEVTDANTAADSPAATAPSTETDTYTFTEESKIGFVGSKVTGSHEGGFEKFSGTFSLAGDKPGPGPHTIEIDMTSTWSDNEKLTGHLKAPDFFDVEKFPTSNFALNQVQPGDAPDTYTLSGDFTLHGVTKKISFPATIKKGPDGKVTLDAEFSINRKDFGINYPGKADDLIRDGVVIKLAMVAEPASA